MADMQIKELEVGTDCWYVTPCMVVEDGADVAVCTDSEAMSEGETVRSTWVAWTGGALLF